MSAKIAGASMASVSSKFGSARTQSRTIQVLTWKLATPMKLLSFLSLPLIMMAAPALADNAELNAMLEENASAAAFARLCDDEPVSDQLKSNTMLMLALSGISAQNIQLGSGKFNDVMRREVRAKRAPNEINCSQKLQWAKERLTATQQSIRLR